MVRINMKPPLAQHQAEKRKERQNTLFQNRAKDLRLAATLRHIEALSIRKPHIIIKDDPKPDVKRHSFREWFGKLTA